MAIAWTKSKSGFNVWPILHVMPNYVYVRITRFISNIIVFGVMGQNVAHEKELST